MKKLIATLFVMTLGFSMVAVAAPHYTLKEGFTGRTSILEAVLPVQYGADEIIYQRSKDLTMTYTVKSSINRALATKVDAEGNVVTWYNGNGKTQYDLAQVTYKTNQTTNLTLFTDIDPKPTAELRIDSTLKINDYGIYFLDEDRTVGDRTIHTYYSMMGKTVEVEGGREFGVYYQGDTDYEVVDPKYSMNEIMGKKDSVGQIYTTTDNWVASFDGAHEENHTIDNVWYADMKVRSDEAFFCLFQGPFEAGKPAYLEWDHFEFMFTTGEKVSGQPLPGTLATLLIGGLCAGAFRKRNKK